ncbi:MAG: trypsin-like peptidase domain-containing protein [Thiothrix sp.]|nr:trypsin-like peptidase domain-containing protein [Thiothrix sp.]HPQ96330.1 trypsin-like peptidase domain-containing protein [Thiolinea sp.]
MQQGITRYRNAILLASGLWLLPPSALLEAKTDTPDTPDTKPAARAPVDTRDALKDAVVNVSVVKRNYDTLSPWNSGTRKGGGSGLLLKGGLILTNAHVAANATFLEVQRHGETRRHEASVLYISHDADLALLTTKEKDLYQDIIPLELGELPKAQQEVEVYGFPIGGTTLSVTRGVVSRVEKQNYAHSGENLLAVQVDAAINFGNSGGPVISEGKVVGVAMQSGFFTENIGYMIPTPIIRHFLKDIEDGKQDGFGFPGFLVQSLENPALRRKYGLTDSQTGILVHKTYPGSPAENRIQVGDIITEIDGHKIENNGTVEFRPGEFINYTHYVDLHQLGEQLQLKIIRDGKPEQTALTLDKPGKDYLLVKPNQYDKQPTYFIYGGFVFMPLNQDVLEAMDPDPPALAALANDPPTTDQQEVVIMTQVLPADINKDYHHDSDLMIRKINGESFNDLKDFYLKMQNADTDFLVLEADDGYQIVIDRKEARDKQPAILARYGINADRSADLADLKPSRLATDGNQHETPEVEQKNTDSAKKI